MHKRLPESLRKFFNRFGFWLFAILMLVFFRFGNPSKVILASGLLNINPESAASSMPFDYGFRVRDLQGSTLSLESFKGKVVFLNLWATWCAPCRAEMPAIQKLYDKTDTSQIAFVMLSIDKAADLHKVKKYVMDNRYTFPVFTRHDPVPDMLRVPSIPTTFVVGKEGTVVLKKVGTTNYDTERFRKFLLKQTTLNAN